MCEFVKTNGALIRHLFYRMAQTHSMPYLYRSFLQKSPILNGSCAERDLQLKASYEPSPLCLRLCLNIGGCVRMCMCVYACVGV